MFNKESLCTLCMFILTFVFYSSAHAKSVFAISNHSTSNVRVYDIIGAQINFQTQSSEMSPGAIDLAACFEEEVIFASFDGFNKIELINSKTLKYIKSIPVSPEMAGLVYSQTYNLLFSAERYGSNIHAYSYDPDTQSLTEEAVIELDNVSGIYGICLDEEDMLFYLCESESFVKYYDLQVQDNEPDLVYAGKVDIKLNSQSKIAVGATVYNDGAGTKYLYTTGYNHEAGGQQHNYVIRTSLTDPNETNGRVGVELDSRAVDADINLDTGYLYLTVYDNSLHVYDALSWTTDPDDCEYTDIDTEGYSGPAGVIVGSQYKTADKIGLFKEVDVVACVDPNDGITYTITVDPNYFDHQWVTVIDYLPKGVTFGGSNPNYDYQEHSYTWQLGALAATDDPVVLTLNVTVNQYAEPGGELTNIVYAESDVAIKTVAHETCINCWGEDIVYTDKFATGNNTGSNWANAYTDLQDALATAGKCGKVVWVTGGEYSPGDNTTDTFTIPDGVYVYGGLVGNEPGSYDPNDREFILQKTVLTGYIDEIYKNTYVVTMGNYTKLHGFTIEKADEHGVYGYGNNFSIYRSSIKDNDTGIRCVNGTVKVRWCAINNNIDDGIYHSGGGLLHIKNSDIFDNGWNGIFTYSSNAVVLNSNIHHNGWDKLNNYDNGLRFQSPGNNPTVRNCTIMRNEGNGISFSGSPSYKPDIYNCIFYNNNYHDDLTQFYGGLTAHYSSVTDPADPNSTDCTKYGDNNMKCDPKFAYININDHNLHLVSDSPCIDAGDDTDIGSTEVDIDAEDRIDNTDVDMGADEVSCTDDISNSLDWNGDGLVNDGEYDIFAKAWLSYDPDEYTGDDPNETLNWDPRCDLNNDDFINLVDFAVFGKEWLWQACWRESGTGIWMMGMGGGGAESMLLAEITAQASEIEAKPQAEPSIEEQIEQIKYFLDWLSEIKDEIDEDIWLNLSTSLEEMLKDLEDSY